MIGALIGDSIAKGRDTIARLLTKTKVSPNSLTICGTITSFAAALVIGFGHLRIGASVIILSSMFDMLDGALAKLSGKITKFGSFLDSTLDRYSGCAILIGIILHFIFLKNWVVAGFAFSAMVGSILVSYTRARAENVIEKCKVGYWERGERITYIIIGLYAGKVDVVMYMLGVLTHFTVLHRILHTYYVTTKGRPLELKNPILKIIFADFPRKTIPYDIITVIYIIIPFAALIIEKIR